MNRNGKNLLKRIGIFSTIVSVLFIILNLGIIAPHIITTPGCQTPKTSGIWATLDLTNPLGINNSRFSHNTLISIQGRLFNRITDEGKSGYNVAIEVDDVIDSNYNDITDFNGDFQIDYTIDPGLNIYLSHTIEVTVTDSTPDTVEYRTHYMIFVNTTSFLIFLGLLTRN